jgi:hypothetical protein
VSGLLGARTLLLAGGFLVLGTVAATLFALAGRAATPPGRRRVYGALWVLLLLVGGPLWLLAAAGLGLL